MSQADATYLQRILRARVYDVAIESPLDPAPNLSARLGNRVLLKREDLQPVFSFKLRGAFNKMAGLTQAELAEGVIAAARELDLKVPLVVRLEGTNVDAGKKLLSESGLKITPADGLTDAAKKVVAAAKGA